MTSRAEGDPRAGPAERPTTYNLLFVCTGNTCRSPMAAAIAEAAIAERGWQHVAVRSAGASAGTGAAATESAVTVAAEHGLDLSAERPRGYASVEAAPALVVSVCDRAGEAELPAARGHLHWAIPDPVRTGGPAAFRRAFDEIATRIERLAVALDVPVDIDAPEPNHDRQKPKKGDDR